ncbi:MAG: class I SAM-dependent methyltransferase [Deltaproteobacteria bacterium]|nr:class I SAM-dependent methyltransferase [Deltaproteobacteria bacterium]
MQPNEIVDVFEQMAPGYDTLAAKIAPVYNGLYFMLEAVFFFLPEDARILCVGAGTGQEMAHLAKKFQHWRFTAVEPSPAMMNACRARAENNGFADRCDFHEGFLDTLNMGTTYDGATCFLVSQFILETDARRSFFHAIAKRLKPGGILASADVAAGPNQREKDALIKQWCILMSGDDYSVEKLEQMHRAYDDRILLLPPSTVASIIESSGFDSPFQFFQAGLVHAWCATRKL